MSETRKLGLKLDRAAKLLEVVDSSSRVVCQDTFTCMWLPLTFIAEQWSVPRSPNITYRDEPEEGYLNITHQTESQCIPIPGEAHADRKGTKGAGGNTDTFQGFRDIMEKYLLSVKAGTHLEEPGAHLELDSVVCLGLHVDLSMVNLSMMALNDVRVGDTYGG